VYWRNRRHDAPVRDDDPLLPVAVARVIAAVGALALLTGLFLFLLPERAITIWPWTLTPLTARVVGAVFCLGLAGLGALFDRRWSAARLPLQVAAIMLTLILIAAARAHAELDPRNALTWLLLAGFTVLLAGIAVLLRRMKPTPTPRHGYGQLTALVTRMREDLRAMTEAGDARRFFHGTYLRTTEAVAAEIARGGFQDGEWLERWDIVFADLYLRALDADRDGGDVPAPWRVAFDTARDRPDLPPLQHVLFGINAHINYDLPQALIAVISPADFDNPELLASRSADHRRLDTVLSSRVGAEDAELSAVSRVTLLDRLMRPANRAASRRFLAESREKVWRNAVVLDRARREADERYRQVLAELEKLSADRVADLAAPGLILLKLARRGFGVLLPTD